MDLVAFTGSGVFQWYRKTEAQKDVEFLNRVTPVKIDDHLQEKLSGILNAKEISVLGLHYATVLIQSEKEKDKEISLRYFNEILKDEKSLHYKLAVEVACRPSLINGLTTRRKMFLSAIQSLRKEKFHRLLDQYIESDYNFPNSEIMTAINNISRGDENLNEIEKVLSKHASFITTKTYLGKTAIPYLFEMLISYGANHPLSYERVRRYFLQYELYGGTKDLRSIATKSRLEIRKLFTAWLGENQQVAVDPETGEEYRWDDVLIFDQAISEEQQANLKKAISEKQIIREAIFLFSGGVLVSLNNILPSGIWISKYSEAESRTVFRVTVQTRFQGGFDLAIHLDQHISPELINEEIKWKIVSGAEIAGGKLAAKFGGLWDDFNLWTEEFVGDESVERFIRREYKRGDEATFEKLRNLWKFFVWNAASAYVKFWHLSDMKMELADATPEELVVSLHDYQTECIITSFSRRRKTESTLAFVMNFYESFVKRTEEKYPEIKKASVWNSIFSGIIEAEGVDDGINLINKFRKELENSSVEKKDDIATRIRSFLHNVEDHGYLPKQLYFAVKRFHRWYNLE